MRSSNDENLSFPISAVRTNRTHLCWSSGSSVNAQICSRSHRQSSLTIKRAAASQDVLDINEIIQETVPIVREEVVRHNISVRIELAASPPPIIGDRVQLQQVMMNLIVNEIEAKNAVDGTRDVVLNSQRTEDGQILVSVSDTGVGLPREMAKRLFVPLFTTKSDGTGMGLRICRSIVEAHGGRL
jgi:signal transduction histidine kinase